MVKLQILNLGAKLQLTNPSQTTLLCQYVLSLAKYDQSYDIRDRARFLRQLLFPENPESKIASYAKRILLSSKPAPVLTSKFNSNFFLIFKVELKPDMFSIFFEILDRDHFQLGSLSHYLNIRTTGYRDLPDFPTEAPDPTVRNVEPPPSSKMHMFDVLKSGKNGRNSKSTFYSESEESKVSSSEGNSSDSSEDTSEDSSEDSTSLASSETSAQVIKKNSKERKVMRYTDNLSITGDSESGTASSSQDSSSSEGSSDNGEDSKKSVSELLVDLDCNTVTKSTEETNGNEVSPSDTQSHVNLPNR